MEFSDPGDSEVVDVNAEEAKDRKFWLSFANVVDALSLNQPMLVDLRFGDRIRFRASSADRPKQMTRVP